MTIHHPLGADGLAILALTARSAGTRRATASADEPTPLAPKDWARVARALAAAGATPADLLGREAAELEPLLGGATGAAEVIARLAGRATTLAMEDPATRTGSIVNVSSDNPGGRAVGSNLEVFAAGVAAPDGAALEFVHFARDLHRYQPRGGGGK